MKYKYIITKSVKEYITNHGKQATKEYLNNLDAKIGNILSTDITTMPNKHSRTKTTTTAA